jgi:hypothetical protein
VLTVFLPLDPNAGLPSSRELPYIV